MQFLIYVLATRPTSHLLFLFRKTFAFQPPPAEDQGGLSTLVVSSASQEPFLAFLKGRLPSWGLSCSGNATWRWQACTPPAQTAHLAHRVSRLVVRLLQLVGAAH